MKIGNIEFGSYPVFLAPMEDVTDIGFRLLCKQMGAAMVYSEFVAADALIRMVNKSLMKLQVCQEERPVAIQIYGKEVDNVREAAKIVVQEARPDVLDLNFGCPVKKVAGKGAGAGMLQNVPQMLAITKAVVEAVDVPVTVKTRLGWDAGNFVFGDTLSEEYTPVGGWQGRDLAERLQECGAQALTIHGRTRSQMYTGDADWTLIGGVKRNPRVTIPVIGNGDIKSIEEADEAFQQYGVDAVMIGRATFGQPWIFSREATQSLTPAEKIDILIELLNINIDLIGDERKAILHTRRHLAATPIFKGIPDFRPTRIRMLRADMAKELVLILNEIKDTLGTHIK